MALFGRKTKEERTVQEHEAPKADSAAEKTVKKTAETAARPRQGSGGEARATDRDLSSVLIKPRITEKAALLTEKNIYTFEIRQDATKHDVKDAVKALFDVMPQKVRIVKQKPRRYLARMRGRTVTQKGLKKAYVYLKEGDRIDLA